MYTDNILITVAKSPNSTAEFKSLIIRIDHINSPHIHRNPLPNSITIKEDGAATAHGFRIKKHKRRIAIKQIDSDKWINVRIISMTQIMSYITLELENINAEEINVGNSKSLRIHLRGCKFDKIIVPEVFSDLRLVKCGLKDLDCIQTGSDSETITVASLNVSYNELDENADFGRFKTLMIIAKHNKFKKIPNSIRSVLHLLTYLNLSENPIEEDIEFDLDLSYSNFDDHYFNFVNCLYKSVNISVKRNIENETKFSVSISIGSPDLERVVINKGVKWEDRRDIEELNVTVVDSPMLYDLSKIEAYCDNVTITNSGIHSVGIKGKIGGLHFRGCRIHSLSSLPKVGSLYLSSCRIEHFDIPNKRLRYDLVIKNCGYVLAKSLGKQSVLRFKAINSEIVGFEYIGNYPRLTEIIVRGKPVPLGSVIKFIEKKLNRGSDLYNLLMDIDTFEYDLVDFGGRYGIKKHYFKTTIYRTDKILDFLKLKRPNFPIPLLVYTKEGFIESVKYMINSRKPVGYIAGYICKFDIIDDETKENLIRLVSRICPKSEGREKKVVM